MIQRNEIRGQIVVSVHLPLAGRHSMNKPAFNPILSKACALLFANPLSWFSVEFSDTIVYRNILNDEKCMFR